MKPIFLEAGKHINYMNFYFAYLFSFIKITDPDAVQTHESAIFVQPKKLSNNSDSSNPTLSDASTVPPGGDLPSISTNPNLQEKRRVSIVSDPVGDARLGYDNLGFEPNSRRKISQVKRILFVVNN